LLIAPPARGRDLGFLGLSIDEAANMQGQADRGISSSDARAAVLTLAAREDLEIAGQTRSVLKQR
jgi:acetate kinase